MYCVAKAELSCLSVLELKSHPSEATVMVFNSRVFGTKVVLTFSLNTY